MGNSIIIILYFCGGFMGSTIMPLNLGRMVILSSSWFMLFYNWASSLFLKNYILCFLTSCNWVLRLIYWLINVLLPLILLFLDCFLISLIYRCNTRFKGNIDDSGLDWFIYIYNNLVNGLGFIKICLIYHWVILPDCYFFVIIERLEL